MTLPYKTYLGFAPTPEQLTLMQRAWQRDNRDAWNDLAWQNILFSDDLSAWVFADSNDVPFEQYRSGKISKEACLAFYKGKSDG